MNVTLGLPIAGWWPEINVFAPPAQAALLLEVGAVEIMPALTVTIG